MPTRLVAVAIVVAVPLAARADFVPFSQDRHIHAYAGALDTPSLGHAFSGTLPAPDMGPFLEQLALSITGTAGAHSSGQSHQSSSIAPGLLHASGSTATLATSGANNTTANGRARSVYSVTFDVLATTEVELAGALQLTGGGESLLEVLLEHDTGPVVVQHTLSLASGPPGVALLSQHALSPGRYTFLIRAIAHSPSPPGNGNSVSNSSSFSVGLLVIPSPCTALVLLGVCPVARRSRPGAFAAV